MRPIVVLMGLAALVVAACGSNPPASPSPSPSPAPSQVAAASAASSLGTTFNVRLPAIAGHRVRVVVHDPNGVLSAVRVPTSSESKAVSRAFHGGNAAVTGGKSREGAGRRLGRHDVRQAGRRRGPGNAGDGRSRAGGDVRQ